MQRTVGGLLIHRKVVVQHLTIGWGSLLFPPSLEIIYTLLWIFASSLYIYTSVTVHECSDYLSGRCVVPTTIIFDDFLMRLIHVMLFDWGANVRENLTVKPVQIFPYAFTSEKFIERWVLLRAHYFFNIWSVGMYVSRTQILGVQ